MGSPRKEFAGETCHYCDDPAETRDHVVPRGAGGKNGDYNIVPSCFACNGAKADEWPTCSCAFCERAQAIFATYKPGPPAPRKTLGEFTPTFEAALGEAASRLLRQLEGSAA